ncbi:unnamed protein product, partial [marine sediment metagenome]
MVMGLRAYFLVTANDDLKQWEFVKAVHEVEHTPGVDFVDPTIGSRDMVIMVDAPITVEAIVQKIRAKPWVKDMEVLRIVSIFERHKTIRTLPAESVQGKPVLIVEDEAIMRESLRDWLKDEGYQVETAEQGEEALQRIGEVDFGVVVLDLRLPGKDGIEVLKEARAQRPQLKGIIITAYPSVETAVEAMKLGALDYLPKPVAPDALEKLIRETLGPLQVELKPQDG